MLAPRAHLMRTREILQRTPQPRDLFLGLDRASTPEHDLRSGRLGNTLEREGFQVAWLKPDRDGLLPIADLEAAIRPDTQLVSIMHVNNETGVIQDVTPLPHNGCRPPKKRRV